MNKSPHAAYSSLVTDKYHVYNSLFMSLPFSNVAKIGMLLPILSDACRDGFDNGDNPIGIITDFFNRHTDLKSEEDQISFLFQVVQYVERQIVLFDSIEDAMYNDIRKLSEENTIDKLALIADTKGETEALKAKLRNFGVRYVFTAHPTQFYSPAVQGIIHDLRGAISKDSIESINLLLKQLGRTSFLNKAKPTPFEEAKTIINYLRHVYYDVIGDMYQTIESKVFDEGEMANPELITLGFWPGGDRDGNPFVTADTTLQVANELRMTLMKCYYNHLKSLRRRLTFNGVEDRLSNLSDKLYQAMFADEDRLRAEEILSDLNQVKSVLIDQYDGLFVDELDQLITRVNIFKCHFATIDIRQDSTVHTKALSDICKYYNLGKATFENIELKNVLSILESFNTKIKDTVSNDALVQDTIRNISNLKKLQTLNGEQGCNRYIISNSEDVLAVLNVFYLFKMCGWDIAEITFDIVPLFETIKGMENSEEVMRFLFNYEPYKKHLAKRKNKQTIMLGFSDGTKDGGYLKANWEILKTKQRLSNVCAEYGVEVVFFDGRGGPPARGGGKTHRFYASQGNAVANHEIQITIQGQTISSMFGTVDQFANNCEQLLTAGLSEVIRPDDSGENKESKIELMNELADISYDKYNSLKGHASFIPYLEEMSTLKYYGRANIGSRPGKRGNKKELTLSDLRAISFVGSWSQLKQNVPGYYGIGTAIEQKYKEGRIEEVKSLYREFPYFKALILNSMMSMTKTFFPLTAYMQKDKKYGEFWSLLHDEYELSRKMMLEITGFKTLMEEEAISKASIQVREDIVLPLITVQQYALQKVKEKGVKQSTYEKIVTRSLVGNINASRNSA